MVQAIKFLLTNSIKTISTISSQDLTSHFDGSTRLIMLQGKIKELSIKKDAQVIDGQFWGVDILYLFAYKLINLRPQTWEMWQCT